MSHTLQSGQVVTAEAYNLGQLCAKYQIWAREAHGVTDETSLACFIVNMPELLWPFCRTYFKGRVGLERCKQLADIGFSKTVGEIPDLSDVGNDAEILHTVVEITQQ